MTALSPNRRRRAVRTTAAAGAVSLGLLSLAACDKPTPNAHFTLGSHAESREAAHECHGDDEPLGAEQVRECFEAEDEDVPTFSAGTGSTFRIGVDTDVAEGGWLVFVNGRLYNTAPFTSTYERFSVDDLYRSTQQNTSELERSDMDFVVAQVTEEFDAEDVFTSVSQEEYEGKLYGSVVGVWHATLEPQE